MFNVDCVQVSQRVAHPPLQDSIPLAECVLLNSGTFRSDSQHPPGQLAHRDLAAILPYMDEIVVLHVPAAVLLEILENAVSGYPAFEGRFP